MPLDVAAHAGRPAAKRARAPAFASSAEMGGHGIIHSTPARRDAPTRARTFDGRPSLDTRILMPFPSGALYMGFATGGTLF